MKDVSRGKLISTIGAVLEANLIEQVRFYAKSPLVEIYDEKKMIRFVSGLPISTLNLIAGAQLSDNDLDLQIENALIPFKKYKVPMIWWVGPTTDPKNLGVYLEKHGLKKGFDMPGMYYDLEDLEKELIFPAEFSFRQVDNDSLLQIWAETQSKGFEADPLFTRYIYKFEKSLGTNPDSPWIRYIGFLDEEAVGVSILFCGAGIAAIFNVATDPDFRRQGIGTIMTKIPLMKARDLGYKFGVLKASPVGVHLYRKMHFKRCCKIGLYYLSLNKI
ncbi:MAG: GNAT family N-acetyltransferase [Promethearchaeota archaeon]